MAEKDRARSGVAGSGLGARGSGLGARGSGLGARWPGELPDLIARQARCWVRACDRDDVAQETAVCLLRIGADRLGSVHDLPAYVHQVLRRQLRGRGAKVAAERQAVVVHLDDEMLDALMSGCACAAAGGQAWQERFRSRLLDGLGVRDREVYFAVFGQGLSQAAAGEALHLHRSQVRRSIARIKARAKFLAPCQQAVVT